MDRDISLLRLKSIALSDFVQFLNKFNFEFLFQVENNFQKLETNFTDLTDYASISTITGWSSFTTQKIYYKKIGKLIHVWFNLAGVSNTTTITFTLPYAIHSNYGEIDIAIWGQDNSVNLTTPAKLVLSSSTATAYKDGTGAAWTNANNKSINGSFFYEAA